MCKRLSFKNSNEWLKRLDSISFGIKKDNWKVQAITVKSEIIRFKNLTAQIQYRGIIRTLWFLFGHCFFAVDLSYAPIQQFTNNDNRVYTEINTAEWWWKTQEQLLSRATVIPLIIATNKIVLT